jgi:hypothetical protein
MRRIAVLLVIFIYACAARPTRTSTPSMPGGFDTAPTSGPIPTAQGDETTTVGGVSQTICPLTAPTEEHPTDTDVFGRGPGAEWYCSDDGELCAVKNGPWPTGGWKVGWRKPMGSVLEISGARLDGAAEPMEATVPDGYGGTFQATGLDFTAPGCWQIEARAEESSVHFVVRVIPREEMPTPEVPATATPAPDGAAPTGNEVVSIATIPTASAGERENAPATWLYLWTWESLISIVDPGSGHALHHIPFEGQFPGVAVSPDGGHLYVVDGPPEGRLRVFDTATWAIVHQEPITDRALLMGGNGAALSGDGRWLLVEHYSTEWDQAWISLFDTQTFRFLERGTVGTSECERSFRPVQLAGRPGHERLYSQCGDGLIALDAATLIPLWRTPAPVSDTPVLALAPDGGRLYGLFPRVTVTYEGGQGHVSRTGLQVWAWAAPSGHLLVNTRLGDQVTVPTATFGRGDRGYLEITPDGRRLYVAWEDRLWALDPGSLEVTRELSLPAPVDGLAQSADGRELYLLAATSGDLAVREQGLWTVDTDALELTRQATDWPRLSVPLMLAAPAP